jgi:hypothetical protein
MVRYQVSCHQLRAASPSPLPGQLYRHLRPGKITASEKGRSMFGLRTVRWFIVREKYYRLILLNSSNEHGEKRETGI